MRIPFLKGIIQTLKGERGQALDVPPPKPTVTPEAEDMMRALQAVGCSEGQCFGQAAAVLGADAVKPAFDEALARDRDGRAVIRVLDGIAEAAPEVANAWFWEALVGDRMAPWKGFTRDVLDFGDGGGVFNDSWHRTREWITDPPASGAAMTKVNLPYGLKLNGCPNIHRLPMFGEVHGLDLADCTGLEGLPTGMKIRGSLMLDGCTSLRALPNGLDIDGYLDMRDCPAWDGALPADLKILFSIAAKHGAYAPDDRIWKSEWCGIVTEGLDPREVDIQAWRESHPGVADFVSTLEATGASRGEALGQAIALFGEGACRDLWEAYSSGLKYGRDVVRALDGIAQSAPDVANRWLNEGLAHGRIRAWKDMLYMEGKHGLHLNELPWVRSLPDGLHVKGSLSIVHCHGLTGFPRGLQVDGKLDARGCQALTVIPDGFQVGDSADFTACRSLIRVEGKVFVGKSLDFMNCPDLCELPDGMRVGGRLALTDCSALASLPEGLVAGALNLRGCRAWDGRIPDDAAIRVAVTTPRYAEGLPLASWRLANPRGERAGG